MNTSCEHCIFAIKENGIQTGCKLGRLDKFKKANQVVLESNNCYIINNFCNTCRNIYWDELFDYQVNDNALIDKVKEEVKVKFDALIDIEKADEKKIKSLIKKLNTDKYLGYLNKIVLFGEINEKNIELVNKFASKTIVGSLNISTDKFTQTARHVHLSMANYLVFLVPGTKFDFDMEQINKKMNEDLQPIIYSNNKSHFIVSTFFYKSHIQYDNPIKVIIEEYNEYGQPKS